MRLSEHDPESRRSDAAHGDGPDKPQFPGYGRYAFPSYGRYVGLLALAILVLITLNTILTKPNGATGIPPGSKVPPFAVPLALSSLEGDADIALHPNEGLAGKHAACTLRSAEILNICQLYEHAPVVLALFVNAGSCPDVVADMQKLAPSFPGVRFAGVQMRGSRSGLRDLVRARHLSIPIGFDRSGDLATLYKLASCMQVSFIYPGGRMQSKALLSRPSSATLRARVNELLEASKAHRST